MQEGILPPKEAMEQLLAGMTQHNASDLHIKVGYAPCYRIVGNLRKLNMTPLPDSAYVEAMLADLIPQVRRGEFEQKGDLDFSTRGTTGDRYRVNLFRSTGETHASIRRVQSAIPSFESLGLPPVYQQVIQNASEGLILISGVTGSGKSSTLAAMLEHINQTRSCHLITIEDPIEYVFHPKKSIISQREIGIDVPSYSEALRFMVRQDPDCILIGELRDRETMTAALQAAETGHLVLGSLHVADAQQTFARILEFFPREEHSFIRSSLSNSLRAIMCQKLIGGIEPNTRYPATEVLLRNSTVRDKILHEEDGDLPAIIAQSESEGMRSFTTSLCELVLAEKVHYDAAMELAPNREALTSAVRGIKATAQSLVGRSRKG
ncbi:MAG: PilT/PilU family type 4a pilus ATPase [Planctomycetes bacterium]|nr:PilT/PilU family type 4a pilus ATPase [Planctomycetota bacterium]MBI3836235.1 PilT/PilU family type 4a pilus ATPase [Planctomycetota bacterium]